jgi:hypothetical protein
MDLEGQLKRLDWAFSIQKARVYAFVEQHNANLPIDNCPECCIAGHIPGLPCPNCGYEHPVSFAIIRDGEWGYEAVAIDDQKRTIARFDVECP